MKIAAVAAKEFWGLLRQPQLLLLLLVGPVLIMLVFGLSLNLKDILLPRVLVVVEPDSEGAKLLEQFRDQFTNVTTLVGTTDDLDAARQRLLRGEVDAVITMPSDPLESVSQGEQATLGVTYNTTNPVFGTAVPERSYGLVSNLNLSIVQMVITQEIGNVSTMQEQVDELNRQLEEVNRIVEALSSEEAQTKTANLDETLARLEESLGALQDAPGENGQEAATALGQVREARQQLKEVQAAQEAGAEEIKRESGISQLEQSLADLQNTLSGIPDAPAWVLANPLRLDLKNLASPPSIVGFYAPGVLALLMQHIALSLACLSVIRERLSGAYEFFEVSPLKAWELLAGKFLTYFGVVLGVGLAITATLVSLIDIRLAGGVQTMALAMALLTAASLGLGFLISALTKSQLQAVQVSMLLLLASMFFTGFLFPLSDMGQPARAISYFLPATYGIRALQDIMILGDRIASFDLAALVITTAISLSIARYLMGRKKH